MSLRNLFPESIFGRKLNPNAERRLRLSQARAEETIIRGHVDNALMFVDTLAEDRFRMTADRDVRPDAARAVVAANGSLRRLSVDEPSLEAIYARYFQSHKDPSQGARHAA